MNCQHCNSKSLKVTDNTTLELIGGCFVSLSTPMRCLNCGYKFIFTQTYLLKEPVITEVKEI